MDNNKDTGSSTSLAPNIAAMLTYVLGFITGIIFIIIEKENKFVRFHAMQSIIISASLLILSIVLGFVPIIGWLISLLITPFTFVLWVVLIYKAYNNEWFELPVIGKIAREQVDKINM